MLTVYQRIGVTICLSLILYLIIQAYIEKRKPKEDAEKYAEGSCVLGTIIAIGIALLIP